MELRQIKYFLAVAEELHFRKAAEKLHIAEQPLSQQIRKLEDELGFKLLDRTTRSVSLTPAGESFMADGRKLIEQSERAADTARRIAAGEAGVVRLGYESATVPAILPDYVKLFRAEYPEIDLVLVEYPKAGLGALLEGDIDACVATRYERLPKWTEFTSIAKDYATVALPIDHVLAEREKVCAADLAGGPFLGYTGVASGPANQFMARLAVQSGLELEVSQEAESYLALLGLVAAGLGYTIVTGSMSGFFSDRIAYRALVRPEVAVEYGLVQRKDETAPTARALTTVAQHLKKIL